MLGRCVVVAAMLVALDARAQQQPGVTLGWSAPDGCPSRAAVEAEIARLLVGTKATARPLDARATVTQREDVYRLRLEITRDGANSAREVDGRTCLAVAHAAALMIAIAIDPEAARAAAPPATPLPEPAAPPSSTPGQASQTSPPGTPAPGAPPGPAAPPPVSASAPSPTTGVASARILPRDAAPRPTRSLPFRVFVGGVGDVGTIGAPTAGVEIGAALLPRPFRFDVGVTFWPPREVASADTNALSADVDLIAGSAGACLAPPPLSRAIGERFELDVPCVALEIGRMHAEALDAFENDEGGAAWIAARPGAGGTVLLPGSIALRLRVEAVIPFARPRFHVDQATIHEPGPAGRAALSVEFARGSSD
jgi:hypothetical protein